MTEMRVSLHAYFIAPQVEIPHCVLCVGLIIMLLSQQKVGTNIILPHFFTFKPSLSLEMQNEFLAQH